MTNYMDVGTTSKVNLINVNKLVEDVTTQDDVFMFMNSDSTLNEIYDNAVYSYFSNIFYSTGKLAGWNEAAGLKYEFSNLLFDISNKQPVSEGPASIRAVIDCNILKDNNQNNIIIELTMSPRGRNSTYDPNLEFLETGIFISTAGPSSVTEKSSNGLKYLNVLNISQYQTLVIVPFIRIRPGTSSNTSFSCNLIIGTTAPAEFIKN